MRVPHRVSLAKTISGTAAATLTAVAAEPGRRMTHRRNVGFYSITPYVRQRSPGLVTTCGSAALSVTGYLHGVIAARAAPLRSTRK